ncbi:MAG: ABC transporter substrate-binding protein [Burkholderiaceae bacterium]|nr:ABC transporter substrate-binding protein [Burkholderiaceae bacterium]
MRAKRKIVLAALLAAAGMGISQVSAGEMTLVTWGGAYKASQQEAFVKPFIAKTGHKVLIEDYSGGLAQIRAQVKTGKVTWDVVDLELQDALRACDEGLLERIDAKDLEPSSDGTTAANDYMSGAIDGCTVGNNMWANVVAYDSTKFSGAAPKTIADFFDVKKFPGKRGMKKSPKANLEWALIADGVPPGEIYKVLGTPAGIDRAFRKLDTIKPYVVWWEAGAQAPQLLADGEVVMTSAYNGRIEDAIGREKKPFVIIWDGQIPVFETFGIVKGTKNLATAREFVRFATTPRALADMAKQIPYGPLRKSALALMAPDVRSRLPSTPENMKTAIPINAVWWADNLDDLNQRFSVWLTR